LKKDSKANSNYNNMSKKSVFCFASNHEQAEEMVDRLKTGNFSNNDISVLFPDKGSTRDFAHEKKTKAPEGIGAGAGTGGLIGGALGWMAGIALLAIPGAGPFVARMPVGEFRGQKKKLLKAAPCGFNTRAAFYCFSQFFTGWGFMGGRGYGLVAFFLGCGLIPG
jgi:hypothetical protein